MFDEEVMPVEELSPSSHGLHIATAVPARKLGEASTILRSPTKRRSNTATEATSADVKAKAVSDAKRAAESPYL